MASLIRAINCLFLGLCALLVLSTSQSQAFKCFNGNHSTVTSSFPAGAATCDTESDSKYCIAKRRKNWEIEPGYFELFFGCGWCYKINKTLMDCHECFADYCNNDYINDLVASLNQSRLCYLTVETDAEVFQSPVRCPPKQICATGLNPEDPDQVLAGCEGHCRQLWKNCTYCSSDLCNSNATSYVKPTLKPSPTRRAMSDMILDETVSFQLPVAQPSILTTLMLAIAAVFAAVYL